MTQPYDALDEQPSRSRPQSYHPPPPSDEAQSHQRPRAASQIPSGGTVPSQPINDAVNSALSNRHESAGEVDPELVARVTEQVIYSMKHGGQTTASPPSSQTASNSSAKLPVEPVIIPPSPIDPAVASYLPSSQEPTHMDGHVDEQRRDQRSPERQTSPPSTISSNQGNSRPLPPKRDPTDDRTTLEKIWQPLFDTNGNPTTRLSQFLQGLAIHVIEDFEPKRSIVITPEKMLKFYETVKVADEVYPWNAIFGGTLKHSSLSYLYRDLQCQHHFVQTKCDDRPTVPALTPAGFETWMTCVIRAHPDIEYIRFAQAVLHMPISNADDVKERFPKELSRRLFPLQPNIEVQKDLEYAITDDPVIELTPYGLSLRASSVSPPQPIPREAPPTSVPPSVPAPLPSAPQPMSGSPPLPVPPPPSTQRPTSPQKAPPPPPPTKRSSVPSHSVPPPSDNLPASLHENNLQQVPSRSSETAVDDTLPPVSIERERKPYYAQPGGGKVYDGNDEPRDANVEYLPHPRANTTATSTRPIIEGSDEYPVSPRFRSGSEASKRSARRRYRSPTNGTQQNAYSRSDADIPPTAYGGSASNLRPDYEDDGVALGRVYSRDERQRRGHRSEELPREYPPPPRVEYEDDYYTRPPANYYPHQFPPPPPQNPPRYS